ncbi:MAG: OmpA family protein [Gallionellaceae bacterium]
MKKIAKTVGTLGLLGCAVITSAFAAEDESFWYIGGNIGQSRAKIDEARIVTPTLNSISIDDRDTAYKLLGGYQFSDNFSVEGGYFDLGQFSYVASTTPPATAGTKSGSIKLNGLNIDAVGMLPLTEKFSAFGRLGLIYAQAQDSFSSTGAAPAVTNPSPSKTAANYKLGVGLQYDFSKALGMRVEAERYRIDDAIGNTGDVDMYSLGLVYRFDRTKPAPARKAAEPAKAVATAPIYVIVPVKVMTAQYCSVLDMQFEINQDEMQAEEKERLAVLGNYMKKYPDTTAVIEGHSDNVGPSEKNKKLSQERAQSVVNYLMENFKIAESRLTAVGYGETRPIADNSTREGQQANRRIGAVIACVTDIEGLKVKAARVTMAMELEFEPYSAEIQPAYRDELARVAKYLKANPSVTATVEAHAGKFVGKKVASEEVSMEVSKRRAASVANYLVEKLGVPRSQVSTEAFGQARRVAYGTTLEGQQENRRVNIIFNYRK